LLSQLDATRAKAMVALLAAAVHTPVNLSLSLYHKCHTTMPLSSALVVFS
jgi:hypothetical protein